MKKILLASTALFAVSGAAAFAQVSDGIAISGRAEMGIAGATADFKGTTSGDVSADLPMQFYQELDLDIVGSGMTDGGLSFGFDLDIDEADDLGNNFDDMGTTIFVSGEFGTVTLGDTDGALDFVITEGGNIGNPGSINDAETDYVGYLGSYLDGSGDGQIVRYDYSFDAFTFALSAEQGPTGPNGTVTEDDDDITWAIGFGYEFEFAGGSVDTGIGYQWSDNGSITLSIGDTVATGLGLADDPATPNVDESEGEFTAGSGEAAATAIGAVLNLDSGFSVGGTYTLYDFDQASKGVHHWSLGAGYSFDAFSVHANYNEINAPEGTASGYGLSAGYDLGGGAMLLAGYGQGSIDGVDFDADGDNDEFDESIYSLGLSFSF
jgi:outer membrane protein OmpU